MLKISGLRRWEIHLCEARDAEAVLQLGCLSQQHVKSQLCSARTEIVIYRVPSTRGCHL